MTIKQLDTDNNAAGSVLEQFIFNYLKAQGYTYIAPVRFTPAHVLRQPIYTRKFYVGKNIYNTSQHCHFILYHPSKWLNNLIIESRWQTSSGSVDEKYPYDVLNIQTKYATPTILILDGSGYRKGAENWIRAQAGSGNLLLVLNMQQFTEWVNNGNL